LLPSQANVLAEIPNINNIQKAKIFISNLHAFIHNTLFGTHFAEPHKACILHSDGYCRQEVSLQQDPEFANHKKTGIGRFF
jgi:hypothetical protein